MSLDRPAAGPRAGFAISWLLACLLVGCHPGADAPGQEERFRIRRLISYNLLTSLDEADTHTASKAPIEPRMVTVGGEIRPAINAHAPSEIRFESVWLAADARLSFAVGIADAGKGAGDGVGFVVRVEDSSGSPVEVWSRRIDPDEGGWVDAEVELEEFAGSSVDLILATERLATAQADFAAWGEPVLRSAGHRVDLRDFPIRRQVVLGDVDPGTASQRLRLPARAVLDLAGEIRRTPQGMEAPFVGPVDFVVRQDGEPVLTRALRSVGRRRTFSDSLSFEGPVGREVELALEIHPQPGADVDHFTVQWLSSSLSELVSIERSHKSQGPNLLFIVVDTLRADHLGCYGYHRDTSPNLDRLARESLVFTHALSQSSWTLPATATLLTGLYPTEHLVTDAQALRPRLETMPELLQERGFTTFAVVANPVVGRDLGFHQGFEHFTHLPWARAGHVNDLFRSFVEENRDLRWFAYLHYIDPHDPYDAPAPFAEAFMDGLSSRYADGEAFKALVDAINFDSGQAELEGEDLEYLRRAYDSEILYWDSEFGGLIESMESLGLLDDTVIVVTSDHGEEFLEHGKLKHGIHLYEESLWVPLILRAPLLVAPGRREGVVETRELFHTIFDLMGVPEGREEKLLKSSAGGMPAFSHTNHALLADRLGRTTAVSVRDSGWKFIAYTEAERIELYDLRQDPEELSNRAWDDPETRSRYQALLERWLVATARENPDELESDPKVLEQLRDLGYIQ